jgi:hypothetical protein
MDPLIFFNISSYSNTYCDDKKNQCKLLTALQFQVKKYYLICLQWTMQAWGGISTALVK